MSLRERLKTAARLGPVAASLAGAALVAAAVGFGAVAPALSQAADPDLSALLDKAQSKADAMQGALGDWAQSIQAKPDAFTADAAAIEAASEGQATKGIGMMDDPALRQATLGSQEAGPGQGAGGGVYVAVSLSMPPEALRALAADAHKAGARVVIRGIVDGSFKATLAKVKQVFSDQSEGGLAIDPQVFKAFDVASVPTFIAAAAPVRPCGALGCVPTAPPYDKIAGNISLEAALSALADEGDGGRRAAQAALDRLKS